MKRPVFINPFYQERDTLLVAGSGRSGTTWLGNIIAQCPGFMTLFEPFDYRHVPELSVSSLRQYIRPDEKTHVLDKTISAVLRGKLRNEWMLSQNTRNLAWRILVKEIRANLFLGYIQNRFNSKIIFVVRHPCAVVLSRMELKWETHLDDFLNQQELVEDYLTPYVDLIHNANSEPVKHAVMWSIENMVPLVQMRQHHFIFCIYEDLIAKTDEELNRIFALAGLKVPEKTHSLALQPASTSSSKKTVSGRKDYAGYWKTKLCKDDITSILDTVHTFGIDLYGDTTVPNHDSSWLRQDRENHAP